MNELPKHIEIIFDGLECRHCGARMYVGAYLDPSRAQELIDAWIARHSHGEPS